ncbi:MAG: hypothetical protein KIT14_16890 [bacterium]|nr:hypothetical protein [bacterium]
MAARRLAADCLRLLGASPATVAVTGDHDRALIAALGACGAAAPPDGAAAAVVSFRGAPADPAVRQACLAAVRRRLPPGAPLLLVDHNQPRTLGRRLVGVAQLAVVGLGAARARYPAARELAALGFAVERLRLACGERVQLVLARVPD